MQKLKEFKNKNNVLISLILSIIIMISFNKSDLIVSYNMISVIVLISLYYIIYKVSLDFRNKKQYYVIIILTIIFSLIMVIGRNIYTYYLDNSVDIIREMVSVRSCYHFISYLILFFAILYHLVLYLCKVKIIENVYRNKGKTVFFISFIVIFLCWIPYFLSLYPGGVSPDSIGEIVAIQNNNIGSDHHPVAHQLFMYVFYYIGYNLFSTVNDSVAFVSMVQMLIMSAIFAYTIYFLYNRSVKKSILILTTVFFAISPIFGYYSVTMWKDVLFGGFLLLFLLSLITLTEFKGSFKIRNLISFFLCSLLVVFFRNNAIYMYIIFIPFALLFFKENRKKMVILFTIIISFFLIVKGPVFNYFGITKSNSAEYIGMPLQQIGRMAYKDVKFNDKEKEYLNKLIPLEIMKNVYNPIVSDGIKFNASYNGDYFNDNKFKFFKIYAGLVIKHPDIALEAYLTSTLGYWYPNVMYWSVANNVWENEIGVYNDPKGPKFFQDYILEAESRSLPVASMQWSVGLCFWIILLFATICYLKNRFSYLIVYVPIFGIWLTMMIASPVWGEFRYIFGAYTCLPVLMCYPFICKNYRRSKKNEKR